MVSKVKLLPSIHEFFVLILKPLLKHGILLVAVFLRIVFEDAGLISTGSHFFQEVVEAEAISIHLPIDILGCQFFLVDGVDLGVTIVI